MKCNYLHTQEPMLQDWGRQSGGLEIIQDWAESGGLELLRGDWALNILSPKPIKHGKEK